MNKVVSFSKNTMYIFYILCLAKHLQKSIQIS